MEKLDIRPAQQTAGQSTDPVLVLPLIPERAGRRVFLRYAGLSAAAGIVLSSCSSNELVPVQDARDHSANARLGDVIDLGKDDIGIFNLAFVLEQIEFNFLTRVKTETFNTNALTPFEKELYSQFYEQEKSHIAFFTKALGAKNRVGNLEIDLSMVNFADRGSVLKTSMMLADTATGAYNGSGPLLLSSINLATAGKLVSVEARHAAIVRELVAADISRRFFAGDDIVDANGLDPALTVDEIKARAKPFVKETLNGPQLSKSI